MIGGCAPFDPYALNEGCKFGVTGLAGRTLRNPRLVAGEATGVFVVGGQSNATNSVNTTYTPVSSKIDQVSIYDGACYGLVDPLLCVDGTGGSWWGRLGDKLVTSGKYQRVVFVPFGGSGTVMQRWTREANDLLPRLLAAAYRVTALGLPITAFLWQHGETDGFTGTTSADYQTRFASMLSAVRARGFNQPWLLAKSTYSEGAARPTIQAALAALVNPTSGIYAGPDTDTLTGANRYDGTHMAAAGADAAAELWRQSIAATL